MSFDMKGSSETLDPQDWHVLRALGQCIEDDMLSYLETIRERPVWQPIPEETKAHLSQPLPAEPQGPEGALTWTSWSTCCCTPWAASILASGDG